MKTTFYIETMGCQMNKLDSELIEGELLREGYEQVPSADDATVIIYNTCSVRQHAEDKVISKIGQLRPRYKKKGGGDFVLAIVGCMAERLGEGLLAEYEQVSVVCGPGQIHRLPEMLAEALAKQGRPMRLNDAGDMAALEELDEKRHGTPVENGFASYVRVMRGCNNFCHYCIVPFVRGRETSRPIEAVVDECRRLADTGVLEVTLLGQTVNSYRYEEDGKRYGLADVLEAVHDIEGLKRIRFVTNYPRGFDERIFEAMAGLPKVCEYLHMPAQSGSDRILKAMNRHYTAESYLELLERGREMVPRLTVAGDFIVGFCGETDEDFEQTKELVRRAHYKNCFVFKYSPRPGTRSEKRLADDVPDEVKSKRNHELLELVNAIAYEDNQRLAGQRMQILVEGRSKRPQLDKQGAGVDTVQMVGRTRGDQIVVVQGNDGMKGQLVDVTIERASALTLFGKI